MYDNARVTVIEGQSLNLSVPEAAKKPQSPSSSTPKPLNVSFSGTNGNNTSDSFVLSERLFSQHLLLVGGIGSGKTNTFNHIITGLSSQLGANDVMIIFDTKGDFLREFYKPGDVVISNDKSARGPTGVDYWNIINELADDEHLEENVIEISSTLFADKIKEGGDSFFPNAAKDIVSAVLYHFVKVKGTVKSSNKVLSDFFKSVSHRDLLDLLSLYPQFESMKSYIPERAPEQALGVLAVEVKIEGIISSGCSGPCLPSAASPPGRSSPSGR